MSLCAGVASLCDRKNVVRCLSTLWIVTILWRTSATLWAVTTLQVFTIILWWVFALLHALLILAGLDHIIEKHQQCCDELTTLWWTHNVVVYLIRLWTYSQRCEHTHDDVSSLTMMCTSVQWCERPHYDVSAMRWWWWRRFGIEKKFTIRDYSTK